METLERIIAEHPFFSGLESCYTGLLAGCASNARFAGGTYIFKEGEEANEFYLIRSGKVALEIFAPQRKPIMVATLGGRRDSGMVVAVPALSVEVSRACDCGNACDYARREVPADEVRAEPRSWLRSAEALLPNHDAATGGDTPAIARCLRGPVMTMLETETLPVTMRSHAAAAVYSTAGNARRRLTHSTLRLGPQDEEVKGTAFQPGQFSMLWVFGVGELPISISGDPRKPRTAGVHGTLRGQRQPTRS